MHLCNCAFMWGHLFSLLKIVLRLYLVLRIHSQCLHKGTLWSLKTVHVTSPGLDIEMQGSAVKPPHICTNCHLSIETQMETRRNQWDFKGSRRVSFLITYTLTGLLNPAVTLIEHQSDKRDKQDGLMPLD